MVNHSCTADLGLDVGGAPLAERAGLFVLGRFFDALGLGAALSAGYGAVGERAPGHDRGKALCQAMLVFADGGEAVSDIGSLRAAPGLFGSVPSASTLYRVARGVDAGRLEALRGAFAGVRERVWPKIPAAARGRGGDRHRLVGSRGALREQGGRGAALQARGSGSMPCTRSRTAPGSAHQRCCAPATPPRTPSRTTPRCSTPP